MKAIIRITGALPVLAILLTIAGCSPSPEQTRTRSAGTTMPARVSPPFASLGESAEGIYDSAKTSDWKKADDALATLKKSAQELSGQTSISQPNRTNLEGEIAKIQSGLQAHDSLTTMKHANQVTRFAALRRRSSIRRSHRRLLSWTITAVSCKFGAQRKILGTCKLPGWIWNRPGMRCVRPLCSTEGNPRLRISMSFLKSWRTRKPRTII